MKSEEWFKRDNILAKDVDTFVINTVREQCEICNANEIVIKWHEFFPYTHQGLAVCTRWINWDNLKVGQLVMGDWADLSAAEFKELFLLAVDFTSLIEPTEEEVATWNTVTDIVNRDGCSRYSVYRDIKHGLVAIKYKGKWRIRFR